MSTSTLLTADQLLRMPRNGDRYELLFGELKPMSPAGWKHNVIAARLLGWLARHIEPNDLGTLFASDTGFLLSQDPDTVRAPDIAFIRKDHLPAVEPAESYWPGAPDLAVEIVSPNDAVSDADDKARMWLAHGSLLVWIVNPKRRTVTVYLPGGDVRLLDDDGELSGEDVVPGFGCRVGDIFGSRR